MCASRSAPGRSLRITGCSSLGSASVFNDTLSAQLAEAARYRIGQVALGAATARTSAAVHLTGVARRLTGTGSRRRAISRSRLPRAAGSSRAGDGEYRAVSRHCRRARARRLQWPCAVSATAHGAEARQSLRGLIEGAGVGDRPAAAPEIHTDEVEASTAPPPGSSMRTCSSTCSPRHRSGHRARAAQVGLPWRCAAAIDIAAPAPPDRAEPGRAPGRSDPGRGPDMSLPASSRATSTWMAPAAAGRARARRLPDPGAADQRPAAGLSGQRAPPHSARARCCAP